MRFGLSANCYSRMVAAVLWVFGAAALAEPNPQTIFTDELGDDRDAIVYHLLKPENRDRVKAIVVTTGNVFLRAEMVRQDLRGLGLEIPVIEGTASDLNESFDTRFAASFQREGAHTLPPERIKELRQLAGKSGNGAAVFAEMVRALPRGQKMDVLCMAPVIDLAKGLVLLSADERKKNLGGLISMGLYTVSADGRIIFPYNGEASKSYLRTLVDLYQQGAFESFIHIPSDTLQKRSGLPGGYLPADTDRGLALRRRAASAHSQHPGLKHIILSATEYMMSFFNFAFREYGTGLGQGFVPDNFLGGLDNVGAYLGDLAVAELGGMTSEQLSQLETVDSHVQPRFERGRLILVKLQGDDAKKRRAIVDLQKIDGWALLERRVQLLEGAGQYKPLPSFIHVQSERSPSDAGVTAPRLRSNVIRPLITIFKNSPDDWFNLVAILSSPELRESLRYGGIVVEGFDNGEVVPNALRTLLQSVGETEVPVVRGYTYGPDEVARIGNFAGEQFMHENGQLKRAFEDLPTISALPSVSTAEQLFLRANESARKLATKVDLNGLGECIDYYRWLKANPQYANLQGVAALMAGGRAPVGSPPGTPLEVTRNWVAHEEEILALVDQFASLSQGTVAVLSSNQFGGSLTALTPEGRSVEDHGGAGTEFYDKLVVLSLKVPFMTRILSHWVNWTRGFSHVIAAKAKVDAGAERPKFDPNALVKSLTISPIGLEVLDKLIALRNGEIVPQQKVSLADKLASPHAITLTGQNFVWLERDASQELEGIVRRFTASLDTIPVTAAEADLHHAVRDAGPFSPAAAQARAHVDNELGASTSADCPARVKNEANKGKRGKKPKS